MKSTLLIIISVVLSSLLTLAFLFFNQAWLFPNQQAATLQTQPAAIRPVSTDQLTKLEQKIEILEASYAALLKDTATESTPKTKTVTKYVSTPAAPAFTNQVIYLGSATTNHRSWNQTGVEVTLNSNDYPSGTQARFEAGLKIIGGEASARLTNKTTGAIISITEVSHNTNTTTWKSATPFQLHSGNNTYVVELRSSSGETAVLDGSRIILEKN